MLYKLVLVLSSLSKCTINHIYFLEWSMKGREIYQNFQIVYIYGCAGNASSPGGDALPAHLYIYA